MAEPESTRVVSLTADPRSVRAARHLVHAALKDAGLDDLVEPAALAVSEIVTNALVHAGTELELRVLVTETALRVEVEDRLPTVPLRRQFPAGSATGRGLSIVDDTVDDWGTTSLPHGKVVWFEMGQRSAGAASAPADTSESEESRAQVALFRFPLLMHRAWQEHASTLLREHLLHSLQRRPGALEAHAHASDALNLLHAQIPTPDVGGAPNALMAEAIEPKITAEQILLTLPSAAVSHFSVLDAALLDAQEEARRGALVSPPMQRELVQMQRWICGEVSRQVEHGLSPRPWVLAADTSRIAHHKAVGRDGDVVRSEGAVILADGHHVIVATSPAADSLLGYGSHELPGRRVLTIVPPDFRQAHVAGTTMHDVNGRDRLLGRPVRVPMLRKNGQQVYVDMTVHAVTLDGNRAYRADLTLV